MKKLLLMAILFSALSCIGQDGKLPDKKTMAVIKKAEKVCLYYVNPLTENFSRGNIQGIAIEKDFGKINTADKDSLIFLIYENISNFNQRRVQKKLIRTNCTRIKCRHNIEPFLIRSQI